MHFSSIVVPSLFAAAVAAYAIPDASFYRRDLSAREPYLEFEERDLYTREPYPDFEERHLEERDLYAREIYVDLFPRAAHIFSGKFPPTKTSDGCKSDFKLSDFFKNIRKGNRGKQLIGDKWCKRNLEIIERELLARYAEAYLKERDAYPMANYEKRDAGLADYLDEKDPFSEAYFEERDAYPEAEYDG